MTNFGFGFRTDGSIYASATGHEQETVITHSDGIVIVWVRADTKDHARETAQEIYKTAKYFKRIGGHTLKRIEG